MLPPLRSWLYAPGNNAKLLERVFTAGADAVILDLEDAVPPAEKERARAMVAATVAARRGVPGPALFVRVNPPETGLIWSDIEAVVQPGLDGLRLPKVEHAQTVENVNTLVTGAEERAGLPRGSVPLVCGIETAVGIRHADDIGRASARVVGLAFGAVDFVRDVGAEPSAEGLETLYARSSLVVSSRAAGIRPPVDSVYARIQDDDGLERSTRQGKALGFFGRGAIHPRQIPIINTVYTPTADEVAWAQTVVSEAARATTLGVGAIQLPNGDFVDIPVIRRAEAILQLAERLRAVGAL
jgi:citrate lyase subunit beta/citryl-CoA lyase